MFYSSHPFWRALRLPLLAATTLILQGAGEPPVSPSALVSPVLDIERLRVVPETPRRLTANSGTTCDVLVVGGGLGGVAAAEAAARQGLTVILVEPTSHLGGQLTAQALPVPDENTYIERTNGPATRAYRELRAAVRKRYAAATGIIPPHFDNIGQCWVSSVSGEPRVWEEAIRAQLAPFLRSGRIQKILMRHQLVGVQVSPGRQRVQSVDVLSLDTEVLTRIGARFVLDATETGDVLPLAGVPFRIGQESRSQFGEVHAPEKAHPEWIQSFCYCFAVQWLPSGSPRPVAAPTEYAHFKSLGDYTLDYPYSDGRGVVTYHVFNQAPHSAGPFWSYRRILAASSFRNSTQYQEDYALINWRGNDFHEDSYVGKAPAEQVAVLKRGKAFAYGFLHWLQTECPRDDGKGKGYPEMQPAPGLIGSPDGFGGSPYVRESRRIVSQFTLTEKHLTIPARNTPTHMGERFFDTVGMALYAIDIHPAKGERPLLERALPYYLPLGAFVPASGPANVLPAAKNLGATRIALASARMHPTEWLVGEVSGNLAAFCLTGVPGHVLTPSQVRSTPALLTAFQARLRKSGVNSDWRPVLPLSIRGNELPEPLNGEM